MNPPSLYKTKFEVFSYKYPCKESIYGQNALFRLNMKSMCIDPEFYVSLLRLAFRAVQDNHNTKMIIGPYFSVLQKFVHHVIGCCDI